MITAKQPELVGAELPAMIDPTNALVYPLPTKTPPASCVAALFVIVLATMAGPT